MPHLRPPGLRYDCRTDAMDDYHADVLPNSRTHPIALVNGVMFNDLLPIITSHVDREYLKDEQIKCPNSTSWRSTPELPSAREMLSNNFFTSFAALPSNNIHSSWKSKEKYLETHYRLLREDALSSLKEAISMFQRNPDMMDDRNVCVYTQVHIVGYTWANAGAAPRVEFSYIRSGKRIVWKQTKRLQQGTLVVLSPAKDKFRSICKVAVVAARPLAGVEQNPPQIDLFWADNNEAEFDPSEEYIMLEARSGYYEATRHTLVAIQKLMTEEFPLWKPLIESSGEIGTPDYLEKQPLVNLNSLSARTTSPKMNLDNVDILKPWPIIADCELDTSQLDALKRILTKKVAIIQGPPGTGKTFVSVCALKVMLDNWTAGDPPIVVAAQTNHALDQLLDHIKVVEPDFLRIGGRTDKDNEDIIKRTLYEVRLAAPKEAQAPKQNFSNTKKALDNQGTVLATFIAKALTQDIGEADLLQCHGLLTEEQVDSLNDEDWIDGTDVNSKQSNIRSWLGSEQMSPGTGCPPINLGFLEEEIDLDFEDLNEREVEERKATDDEIDTLRGNWYPIKETFVGRSNVAYQEGRALKYLKNCRDMYEIPVGTRGDVYRYLRTQLKSKMTFKFRHHLQEYERVVRNLKKARWLGDGYLIRRMGIKLIGCTTTGLSKYRGLLASLRPRTLLVEEAAETTEGTILAAMYESLEQLILVGDHQQLQATCNLERLATEPYYLAVSMFERMVNNSVAYSMLNVQRRMVTELRALLSSFYPDLRDHPSVGDRITSRPHVPGMGGRDNWFFQHTWPESQDDTASRSNTWEADFICRFYEYLVFNGTKPRQITILTFYNGQRKLILSQLRRGSRLRLEDPANLKVFTVDSYQGEENDIVLLSLVRNNEDHKIGFLDNPNRAVVSLSRARRGFYLFGNAINLLQANAKSYRVWGTVADAILAQGRPDDLTEHIGLPVVCQNHSIQTTIKDPQDFEDINGGCQSICGGVLECGHICPYKCHPFLHSDVVCTQSCTRVQACGHGCSGRCGDACRCENCHTASTRLVLNSDYDEHILRTKSTPSTSETAKRSSKETAVPRSVLENVNACVGRTIRAHWAAAWDGEETDRFSTSAPNIHISQELPPSLRTGLVIRDIHKPVVVDKDGRRRIANAATTRHLENKSPKIQSHRSAYKCKVLQTLSLSDIAPADVKRMGSKSSDPWLPIEKSLLSEVERSLSSDEELIILDDCEGNMEIPTQAQTLEAEVDDSRYVDDLISFD